MSHEHLFKHRFLDILELFQLTLMKGDKVVEVFKEYFDVGEFFR